MAKIGDAEELWWVLQVCNPVGLAHVVPHAAPRQSNVCFFRNPYRIGGWRVPAEELSALLGPERNLVEIEL
jgi:hypothetical protein